MASSDRMDEVYHFVLQTFVARGQAPHYTEIAAQFGTDPEGGKALLHELMETGIPAWLHPDTDYVVSFALFHNLPTQYRVTVNGAQKWFAQCGFESLAICWLFPGQAVTIEAPCLDCGEPVRVTVRDGAIEAAEPAGVIPYIDIPIAEWSKNRPYS